MKKVIIVVISIILIGGVIILSVNKTFFKTTYIGTQEQEIFIPRFSYFDKECCMTAAIFYSLVSKDNLENQISEYMKDFKYFDSESTYGYQKGDLFIQEYEVIDQGLYRKIVITY